MMAEAVGGLTRQTWCRTMDALYDLAEEDHYETAHDVVRVGAGQLR